MNAPKAPEAPQGAAPVMSDNVTVDQTPVGTPVEDQAVEVTTIEPVLLRPFKEPDRVPANWEINYLDDTQKFAVDAMVVAKNLVTGNEYKGPISEFNSLMRG